MSIKNLLKNSSLPNLPDVTKLNTRVTRILGQNPGPFTLQGTNTYLIAGAHSSILIDTGQGLPSYTPLLEFVLRANLPVSDIILTHWHRDHVGGLPSVLESIKAVNQARFKAPTAALKPKVWKYKFPDHDGEPSASAGKAGNPDVEMVQTCSERLEGKDELFEATESGEFETPQRRLIHWLEDGQTFRITDGIELKIMHTPGHTDDSISCLLWSDSPLHQAPHETKGLDGIFVGDTVLGGSTSVFDNLIKYLHSLRKLRAHIQSESDRSGSHDKSPSHTVQLYPGHGEVIEDGASTIDEYIQHRLEREGQILRNLHPEPDSMTTEDLMRSIYIDPLPDSVIPAVLRGLRLHLVKLVEEGRVKEVELDKWCLSSNKP